MYSPTLDEFLKLASREISFPSRAAFWPIWKRRSPPITKFAARANRFCSNPSKAANTSAATPLSAAIRARSSGRTAIASKSWKTAKSPKHFPSAKEAHVRDGLEVVESVMKQYQRRERSGPAALHRRRGRLHRLRIHPRHRAGRAAPAARRIENARHLFFDRRPAFDFRPRRADHHHSGQRHFGRCRKSGGRLRKCHERNRPARFAARTT